MVSCFLPPSTLLALSLFLTLPNCKKPTLVSYSLLPTPYSLFPVPFYHQSYFYI
ncbi:MAG: hypothetical protein F6K50_40230 [Moorea sp. SIO3I7]|nr:hypothetical protein [Moorena sp. SIO3I7]